WDIRMNAASTLDPSLALEKNLETRADSGPHDLPFFEAKWSGPEFVVAGKPFNRRSPALWKCRVTPCVTMLSSDPWDLIWWGSIPGSLQVAHDSSAPGDTRPPIQITH